MGETRTRDGALMTKKHHAYIVRWRDSSTLRGWRHLTDSDHQVATINSIGWLAEQTPRSVTITSSIGESGNVCDALTIPREAIVHMKRLKQHIVDET